MKNSFRKLEINELLDAYARELVNLTLLESGLDFQGTDDRYYREESSRHAVDSIAMEIRKRCGFAVACQR